MHCNFECWVNWIFECGNYCLLAYVESGMENAHRPLSSMRQCGCNTLAYEFVFWRCPIHPWIINLVFSPSVDMELHISEARAASASSSADGARYLSLVSCIPRCCFHTRSYIHFLSNRVRAFERYEYNKRVEQKCCSPLSLQNCRLDRRCTSMSASVAIAELLIAMQCYDLLSCNQNNSPLQRAIQRLASHRCGLFLFARRTHHFN